VSQSALRRLRLAACGADLFADPSTGFVYPQFEGLEVVAGIKAYPRQFQRSDHDHALQALGEKEASIKFTTEGRGFGLSPAGAGNAIAAVEGENGLLLKSVFGTQVLQTGSTVTTGTTTEIVKSAGNWALGTFIGIVDPATSLFHVRQIRAKSGSGPYDYTLDRALPIDPADASVLYASATYYHAVSGHQHVWFDAEGYDATPANGWRRYVRGCLGDVALKNLSANGRLMLEWSFRGLDWSDGGQGSNQPAPTYPTNLPTTGGFIRNTRLHIGAAAVAVSEFGYDLGNDIKAKAATSAENGIAEFHVVGAKQGFTFKIAEDDAETAGLRAAWKARTKLDLLAELTQGGPGNSFAIAAPKVQIVDYKPSALNGLDYRDVTCQILESEITGVPAAALGVL
jgi:hypothetical protein